MAAAHNATFLILDELGLLAPEEAGVAAYQLASGQAKARAQANGALRRRQEWKLPFLSTGEIALASHIEASRYGGRPMAGQEVRFIDVEADAGVGLGVWQELHGFDNPRDLSDSIKDAASRNFGLAAPVFLEAFIRDRVATLEFAKKVFHQFLNMSARRTTPARRCAGRRGSP